MAKENSVGGADGANATVARQAAKTVTLHLISSFFPIGSGFVGPILPTFFSFFSFFSFSRCVFVWFTLQTNLRVKIKIKKKRLQTLAKNRFFSFHDIFHFGRLFGKTVWMRLWNKIDYILSQTYRYSSISFSSLTVCHRSHSLPSKRECILFFCDDCQMWDSPLLTFWLVQKFDEKLCRFSSSYYTFDTKCKRFVMNFLFGLVVGK